MYRMIHRAVFAILIALTFAVAAPGATGREVAVLVTCEGISLDQLAAWKLPEFDRLLATGAGGVMNNRTAGNQSFENNAVTIGAGARAIGATGATIIRPQAGQTDLNVAARGTGVLYAREGFNAREIFQGEPAARYFARLTGRSVPQAAVVQPRIEDLKRINAEIDVDATPGLLGARLRDAGVRVAVYGNSDEGNLPSRCAVAIAMNDEGWVPHGDVGRATLLPDATRPFGARTNYPYLFQQVTALPQGQHFLVIEAGDGGRLEAAKASLPRAEYAALQQTAARECGAFLLQLDTHLRAHTDRYLLLLAVTAPNADAAIRQDVLTPVIATGTDIRPGVFATTTTHRAGLLTNLDLAPTVLAFFAVTPPARMIGRPLRVKARARALPALRAMNRQLMAASAARRPVVTGYVIVNSLVAFWAMGLLLRRHLRKRLPPASRMHPAIVLLTAGMLAPVSMLPATTLGIHGTLPSAIYLVIVPVTIAWLLHRALRDPRAILAGVGLLVAGALCVDLAAGSPLLQQSVFSYDAIAGVRFYGIGNESSGVLLGALLLGIYALLDLRGKLRAREVGLVAAVYVIVFVLLGGPDFGADFGGMIAALPGFAYALVATRQERDKRLFILWVSASAVFLLAVMLGVNLLFRHSHIGLIFGQALADGPAVLLDVVRRKAAIYLALFRALPLPLTLVVLAISGLTVLAFRPVGLLRRLFEAYPVLSAGFRGILLILIMAMLTNDTGMAMAATGLVYLLPPLLQLALIVPARTFPYTRGSDGDQTGVRSEGLLIGGDHHVG